MPGYEIGDRIRQCREAGGHSQAWLAKALGVDRSTVFRYENGSTRKITLSTLEKIAELLGTTREYLMYGKGSLPSAGEVLQQTYRSGVVASPSPLYEVVIRESRMDAERVALLRPHREFVLQVETAALAPRILPGDRLTVAISTQLRDQSINLFLEEDQLIMRRVSCENGIVTLMPVQGVLYPEILKLEEFHQRYRLIGHVVRLDSDRP